LACVLIINSVLGDATGGRWRVVCDYSRILQKQGHDVVMLLSAALQDALPGIPDGIEVLRVRSHGHYDVLAAWRLARRLNKRQPAVAIAHCSRSVALLKRALVASTPVIAVTHSIKLRRLLKADAVIALTEILREKILTDPAGCQLPVYVVPNLIEIPSGGCPRPRPLHKPPVIGALGRFDRVKGFDVLVEALGLLARRDLAFTARLAGAGQEETHLRERIHALGLADRVELGGWIPPYVVSRFLADIDLLCVPARSDAFGLTPLQGAVAGVPLLLSTASGHNAMFAENTEALFFEVDDVAALAERIQLFLGDPRLQKRLPAAAYERVTRCYSESVVTQGVLDAIDSILLLKDKI
jgi:glycosyltransferase involved in cell wall biosynthesis